MYSLAIRGKPLQIVSGTRTFCEIRVFRVISIISESEISHKKLLNNGNNEVTRLFPYITFFNKISKLNLLRTR